MSIRFTVMDDDDDGVYCLDAYIRRSSSVIFGFPLEGAVSGIDIGSFSASYWERRTLY